MFAHMAATFSAYAHFASRFLKARLVYRANLWIDLGFRFLFVLMQVYLWRSLLASGAQADTTPEEMVVYVVLSQAIHALIRSGAAERIEERLLSGDIAIDMARPMSYRAQLLVGDLGTALSELLLNAAPLLVAASLFLDFGAPPTLGHFAAFLALLFGGLLISFYTSYIIGLIAFYFLRAEYLSWLIGTIQTFLSGRYIPLWFYPDWLRAIAEISPFKLMFYTPIAAYMGRVPAAELGAAVATLFGWLIGLIALESWLWRRTLDRLVVQGG